MAIVKGDRIGESRRLNSRSIDAQTFYAHMVSVVPDDFGRFRLSAAHIFVRMYPRREPTPRDLKRVERMLSELGGGDAPLWKTWHVDGVTFAEFHNFEATGNQYHRTPEPPWSKHEHNGRCAKVAIARMREWGDSEGAQELSNWLNNLKVSGAERGKQRNPNTTRTRPEHSSPPSPPFPSSVLSEQRNDKRTSASGDAGGLDLSLFPEPVTGTTTAPGPADGHDALTAADYVPAQVLADAAVSEPARLVLDGWRERTGTKLRSAKVEAEVLARIRKRLREGFSVADLLACVEHALTDEWYSAKGYAKQPEVIWRDAGRVNGILERMSGPKARAQPRSRPGMLDGEALLAMAEEMGKAAKSREEGGNAA